jgi:cellobiose-specific phosphotransferase system component IIB
MYDSIPFEQIYAEEKASQIAKAVEVALWQGDLASGTANLNKFDGLLKVIDGSYSAANVNAQKIVGTVATTSGSPTVTGTSTLFLTQVFPGDKLVIGANTYTVSVVTNNTTITLTGNAAASVSLVVAKVVKAASDFFASPVTAITVSNVEAIIDAVYKAIPVEVLDKEDTFIACGTDVFRLFTIALKTANLYHYNADAINFELFIPGTNIKLVALNGLNGTSRIIAGRKSNMYMGVDLMNEEERFEIFYARENDEVRFMSAFKVGTQVAFPSQVANFELTA